MPYMDQGWHHRMAVTYVIYKQQQGKPNNPIFFSHTNKWADNLFI
jgi:hypothetical protein